MGRKVLVDAKVTDMVTVMVTTMGIPLITATQNK